jgi:hypothetical protein
MYIDIYYTMDVINIQNAVHISRIFVYFTIKLYLKNWTFYCWVVYGRGIFIVHCYLFTTTAIVYINMYKPSIIYYYIDTLELYTRQGWIIESLLDYKCLTEGYY